MRPSKYTVDLLVKREGKQLNFYNAWNTNIDERQIKVFAEDKTDCKAINGHRLYADQSW